MKLRENKGISLTGFVITILVILLIAAVAGCVYLINNPVKEEVIVQNPTPVTGNNSSSETLKNESEISDNVNSLIIFDGSKSINSNGKKYTLNCQGNAGIWIEVDSTQKGLTFSFTPTKVVEYYSLNWTSNKDSVMNSKINFNKKIVDVFFGGMGQSMSGDTVFILLEDGTVEYIPIVHMFNNVQGAVSSYGKINGVSDVVKFTLASTSDGDVTTLAIKKDGTFYDLWYSLKDKGNY